MSQHDMVIDNGPGLAVRTDINAALQALVGNNAGPVEPTTKYAGMLWLDTTVAPDGLLRQRNQANSGWVALQSGLPAAVISSVVLTLVTSSGTYTRPAGLLFLEVTCYGAGGGGGGCPAAAAGQGNAGVGGNGGAKAMSLLTAAAVGASQAMTIGAGGAGVSGGAGAAGGPTTFGSLVSAAGGNGGSAMGPGSATYMAPSSGPILSTAGQVRGATPFGQPGFTLGPTLSLGGGGGGGELGGGAAPATQTSSYQNGNNGQGSGGGGGGAAGGPSHPALTGGTGASGCIILKEYF